MAEQIRESEEAGKVPQQGEYTPSVATEFMRQTIKQRPVNKKKLVRRTITTMVMAVVFGMVACLTFLILQPVINSWLNPEKKAEQIAFPEEVEEAAIDDFYIDDNQMKEEELEGIKESTVQNSEQKVQAMLDSITLDSRDYETMYASLRDMSKELEKSVVTVTGVTNDTDWFNNIYSNEQQASGVVVANNGRGLLIAVKDMDFGNAESVIVSFNNDTEMVAEYVGKDPYSGIAVIAAPFAQMPEQTRGYAQIIKLGTSNGVAVRGTPVIALGSPSGTTGSISYGMITSNGTRLGLVDSDFNLLTTDIYGSAAASGILVTLKGYMIGVIDNSYNNADTKNLISAIGISELKPVIEKLSNNEARAYMGIHGMDVPAAVQTEMNIPKGAYVSGVEMNSPAMAAGIQTGDIIVAAGGTEITGYREFLTLLNDKKPENILQLKVMRQTVDEYAEIALEIILDSIER